MGSKKFKVNRKKDTSEQRVITKEFLLSKYSEINKPFYDDSVLVVLGGEYGVIASYLVENFKFSGLIIIEPNPKFMADEVAQANYQKITQKHQNIKYIKVPEVEEDSRNLLDLMLELDIFKNGLEIIHNPFYSEEYKNEMAIETNKLESYLNRLKTKRKGISSNNLVSNQIKQNLTLSDLSKYYPDCTETELQSLFNDENPDIGDGSFVVLIGGEYGFYLKTLLEKNIINNLFVVEPEDFFAEDLQTTTFFDEIEQEDSRILKRFNFTETKKDYLEFFDKTKSKLTFINNAKILINPLYSNHPKLVETMKLVTKYLKSTVFVKGNSMADELYGMTNSLYNLNYTNKMRVLKEDAPSFDTFISVAAGPSLDDHMEELKALANKFPVVAVEVVANKLLKNGIVPDIICSQERTFMVSQITKRFDDRLKKESLFVAPNLIHPFNFENTENPFIFSQGQKSPLETHLYDTVYNSLTPFPQSVYAGEVNILTAMQFHPKEVLLFGHDLAFTKDKNYAQDVDSEMHTSLDDAIKEEGNRGQAVYLDRLFYNFRNNTEVMLSNLLEENDVRFITFSDGAKTKHIEDSKEGDFEHFNTKPGNKENILQYTKTVDIDKEHTLELLEDESTHIQNQITFLNNLNDFSKFTIIAKFTNLFLHTKKLGNSVARLLLDEFLSQYMYIQDNMDTWVKEHKDELLSIYTMIEGVLIRTKDVINQKRKIPKIDASDKDLFEFNFFAPIREKAIDHNDKLRKNIPIEELKYILLAYYYSFEDTDYFKMSELLGQLEQYIDDDEDAKQIYYEGINRQIAVYTMKWNEMIKTPNENLEFFRYQLTSYQYKVGNVQWVIDFLSEYEEELGLPERVVLADALSDSGEYTKAFKYYKLAIDENKSARVLINTCHCLIMSEKIAEAEFFRTLYAQYISKNEVFKRNVELLDKQIAELSTLSDKKLEQLDVSNIEKMKRISFENTIISEQEADKIIELYSKENDIQFYKIEESQKKYYYDKNVSLDLSFFISGLH